MSLQHTEPNEDGSSLETGIGNVDRLACAIAKSDGFTKVLYTGQVGTERICTPGEGKCCGSTE